MSDKVKPIRSDYRRQKPIREGCYIEYRHVFGDGTTHLIRATVISHKYTDQGHFFIIEPIAKWHDLMQVTGAKIYKNLLYHEPGERSKIEMRRARKKGTKLKRKRRKEYEKRRKRTKRLWK